MQSVLLEGTEVQVLLHVHIVFCGTEVEYVPVVPVLDCTLAEVVEARLVKTTDDAMSFVVECSEVVTVTAADVFTGGVCVSREGEVVCGAVGVPWKVLVG